MEVHQLMCSGLLLTEDIVFIDKYEKKQTPVKRISAGVRWDTDQLNLHQAFRPSSPRESDRPALGPVKHFEPSGVIRFSGSAFLHERINWWASKTATTRMKMRVCEKSACSIENWYPKLRNWSIRTEYEVIPDDVVTFLRSDGVTVPVEAAIRRKKTLYVDDITFKEWDSEDDGDSDEEMPQPTFPGFSAKLSEILERFGGNAFIKLNWSSPTDAAWIATNSSLKCSNLQDIYLLLKGSNKISTDLDAVVAAGSPKFFVVLKEWQDIHPGSEFRCFVSAKELVGISQRNSSEFHIHIQQNVCAIVGSIKDFFYSNVKSVFPLNNYTLDVIWSPSSIKVIDFNTFGDDSVNPCLFSWSELKEMDYIEGVSPEFRYISEDIGIQPVHQSQHFGLPIDLTEISQEKSQSIIDILQARVDSQRNTE